MKYGIWCKDEGADGEWICLSDEKGECEDTGRNHRNNYPGHEFYFIEFLGNKLKLRQAILKVIRLDQLVKDQDYRIIKVYGI